MTTRVNKQSAAWDTSDPLNPQPSVWPVCPTCKEPYSYQYGLNFLTGNVVWSWGRTCKHKVMPVMSASEGSEVK